MDQNIWNLISSLDLKTAWKIGEVFGPGRAIILAKAIHSHVKENGSVTGLEDLTEITEDPDEALALMEWADQYAAEHLARKRQKKLDRFQKKGEMKVRYLPTSTLIWYEQEGDKGPRWKFERETRGMGLMQAVVEYLNDQGLPPVAIPIQDMAENDEDDEKGLPESQIRNLYNLGLMVSQNRWAWNLNRPTDIKIWGTELLERLFPNAVDATAYNHGLNAPTVPGGIWLNEPVRLTTIQTLGGEKAGCDGSGRIHPRLLDRLERGTCTVQLRMITENGTFAKGILVPDERCVRWTTENTDPAWAIPDPDGQPSQQTIEAIEAKMVEVGAVDWCYKIGHVFFAYPEIWVDWAQVKGSKKELAKQFLERGRDYTIRGHIGIIQVWDKRGTLDWCFEVLENIVPSEENWETLKEYVDQAFERLMEQGVDGLAARVAKDSPTAALAVKFITMLNAHGKNYSPLAIPWLREAVEDRLQRILWHCAQGAGQASPRYVAVIDNAVPQGKVVLAGPGFKPGTEVALFRVPLVLAQVLNTCVVTEPLPHHLVDGKIVPYTIFMNADDITARLMGDDDGDVVGVTADPKIVKLFRDRVDHNVYLIEPKGQKINKPIGTPEGIAYMARDQRGMVGKLTIARAKLLAVQDIWGANAISILIQEAIDKAKRFVEWTDWRLATNPDNWKVVDGKWHFSPTGEEELVDHKGQTIRLRNQAPVRQGHVDMRVVNQWVNQRLMDRGVPYDVDNEGRRIPATVLGWRKQAGSAKRIKPQEWKPTIYWQKTQGGVEWSGGNLVHRCFDYALQCWQAIEDQFILGFQQVQLSTLVHELLAANGHEVPIQEMSWTDYERGLRKSSGVQELGKAFREAKETKDEESRYSKFDTALENFHNRLQGLSTQQIAQIWHMECKYSRLDNPENQGNINYAYYAVAWAGSPILKLLGMDFRHTCDFLDRNKAVEPFVVQKCLATPNPLQTLRERIQANTTHGDQIRDEAGNRIEAWECPDCTERLQKLVVGAIRRDKTRHEHDFVKGLVTSLNQNR